MSATFVGPDHSIAGILHVQILRDDASTDPQSAFSAQINAPGFSKVLPITNGSHLSFPVKSGAFNATVQAEVDDFRFLPAGATGQDATAISCKIVFALIEFIALKLGSIDVTAALAKSPQATRVQQPASTPQPASSPAIETSQPGTVSRPVVTPT